MANAGVQFPLDPLKGDRSTTGLNQGCYVAALKNVNSKLSEEARGVKNWRFGYARELVKQMEVACSSTSNAYKIAEDGLDYLHSQMVFARDNKEISLKEAMVIGSKTLPKPPPLQSSSSDDSNTPFTGFHTGTFKGNLSASWDPISSNPLKIPYNGEVLTNQALEKQVDTWVRKGVIEMSAGQGILEVARNSEWRDLRDTTVVLCGAGSAMGPYPLLMAMGATVVALDLPRPGIWKRLFDICKDSPGQLIFPMGKSLPKGSGLTGSVSEEEFMINNAGCDMLVYTPEIRDWLLTVKPKERYIVGAYAYLDGPLFVRVSMAMDAIIKSLCEKRVDKNNKIGIAYLCTPTDVHVCSAGSQDQASAELKRSPIWQHLYNVVGGLGLWPKSRRLAKAIRAPVECLLEGGSGDSGSNSSSAETVPLHLTDSIVIDQGPNYILAKRLQHWRAILARRNGHLVSSNVAPATATVSVTSNKLFALAYKGMHLFKPLEVFQQETSNSVMAALLINDIRNPGSVANPEVKLRNPMELFRENAAHGGMFRSGWKYGSTGFPAALAAILTCYVTKIWLLVYNFIQFLGWSYVFGGSVQALMSVGKNVMKSPDDPYSALVSVENWNDCLKIWSSHGHVLSVFQYAAFLEILHPMLGMIRAGVGTTAVQVFSRILLCIVSNEFTESAESKIWNFLMVFAWSFTEVVRYPFLITNSLKISAPVLKYLRYTLFIILYPMGVSGELGTLASCSAMLKKYKFQNVFLIGLKSIFNSRWGMMPIIVMYVIGLSFLYTHMLAQRKKMLGGVGGGKGSNSNRVSIMKKVQ